MCHAQQPELNVRNGLQDDVENDECTHQNIIFKRIHAGIVAAPLDITKGDVLKEFHVYIDAVLLTFLLFRFSRHVASS